ncbi:MAG TPA: c-type cytochrome [Polyangia bacterium]|nr:c-type cytochrome [Polyangia bacterium]
MRLPVVSALAVGFVALAALTPATGCARKPAPPPSPLVEKGRQSYARYCATCHGPAANGYVADNAPSLRAVTFLESASDDFIRAGISRGRPGTAMAAFARSLGGPLDPLEVNAIIAFLRVGGPALRALREGPVVGDAKRGKVVYDANCARCHGTPTQRSSAVHLANPVLLATASDAFLHWAIERGRPPTSMVPWKDALTPAQIDDVVAFVRSMAVPPGIPALPAPPSVITHASAPLPPRQGPIVLNPRGKAPEFALKDDLYVSIAQVKKALDDKRRLIIADARAPSDWLNLHITGAISTPYYEPRALDDIPNDGTWVLAYCACPHHVSGEVVAELRKRGYKHTAVIDEGVFAWQQAKYPVVTAPGLLPAAAPPPQHH